MDERCSEDESEIHPGFGLPSWSPDAQHLYASLHMGVKQSLRPMILAQAPEPRPSSSQTTTTASGDGVKALSRKKKVSTRTPA